MKRKSILFLLLALAFVACTKRSNEFERSLIVADSLMNHEQADSAYRMLCTMNVEAESLPRTQQMRYLLLRSNAQNKAGFHSFPIVLVTFSYVITINTERPTNACWHIT